MIYEKLANIQSKLFVPKDNKNDFGKYNYRSCEDILTRVKPLCREEGCVLMLTNKLIEVGERNYVEADARLIDIETGEQIASVAQAREAVSKKGQDESQITGASSSYARKYALAGLFCIDNEKDADTNEYTKRTKQAEEATSVTEGVPMCTEEQKNEINDLLKSKKCSKKKFEEIQKKYKFNSSADLTRNKAQMVLDAMKEGTE